MIFEIDNVNEGDWNQYLANSGPQGTIFQSTFWAGYLKKTYNTSPIFLKSYDNNGRINGQLLLLKSGYASYTSQTMLGRRGKAFGALYKSILSPLSSKLLSSLSWENGPIVYSQSINGNPTEDKSIYREFIDKVIKIAYEKRCYEIKFARPSYFNDPADIFNTFKFDSLKMGTFLVGLRDPPDDIFATFDRHLRGNIKKSIEQGIAVSRASKHNDLLDLYNLHIQTSERTGTKKYPFSFFSSLWDYFSPLKKVEVFIARINDEPVAGSLCFVHNHVMHGFTLYQSDSARANKIFSNEKLWWEAMKWGHENDIHYFDVSGVELGDIEAGDRKAQGIYFFKHKFRGQLVEYHDYHMPIQDKLIIKYLGKFLKDSHLHN